MSLPPYAIGLMSGTSLDGVDASLVRFQPELCLLNTIHLPFPTEIRQELLLLNSPTQEELKRSKLAGIKLSQLYAAAVENLITKSQTPRASICAIGCHGQTIRHCPDLGYTIQLGDPALLAELTGLRVIADFRSRDIAAGGQGAPLVPAFHSFIFKHPTKARAIVNIGGISNLTFLSPKRPVSGFDCGPGNLLMDAWINTITGQPFDKDGDFASKGHILPSLLDKLLSHPFLSIRPPKSSGREAFKLEWLKSQLSGKEKPEDVQATLLEFTVASTIQALNMYYPECEELYACGGGARNKMLMKRFSANFIYVDTTESLGVDVQAVESYAFAWLARQTLENQPGNLPEVTGARHSCVLGAIYPP
ncbi:MAG: anhydro-N-acetylmuramic acid kinase [Pseudomonadota bacterium]|nr:anhydro-N-acetylmuramic acid kinase [Pseudomonadota bacterium]